MSETDRRQLKIKTNAVKRLRKELDLYIKEHEQEQQKVSKMKAAGEDEHDIKYAEKLLSEATMMIPNTRQRLVQAAAELKSLLDEVESQAADEFGEEIRDAKVILEKLGGLLEDQGLTA